MDLSCFNKFASKEKISPVDFLSAVLSFYDANEENINGNNLDDVELFYTQLMEVSGLFSDLLLSYPNASGEQIEILKQESADEIEKTKEEYNAVRSAIDGLKENTAKLRAVKDKLTEKQQEHEQQMSVVKKLDEEINSLTDELSSYSPEILDSKRVERDKLQKEKIKIISDNEKLDALIKKLQSDNAEHLSEYERLLKEKAHYESIISTDLSSDREALDELKQKSLELDNELKRMRNTYTQWLDKLSNIRDAEEDMKPSSDNFSGKLIKVNNLLNGEILQAEDLLDSIKLKFRDILLCKDDEEQ